MASNENHHQLLQKHRKLLETIKNAQELQVEVAKENLPDPEKLENLSQSDRKAYLATLQKSADDIRLLLNTLGTQQQPNLNANTVRNTAHEHSCMHAGSSVAGLQRLGHPPGPTPTPNNEDDDEDLYENTGPGSRLARISAVNNGEFLIHNCFYIPIFE